MSRHAFYASSLSEEVDVWNGLDQPSTMQIDVHNVVSGWVQPGFSFVMNADCVNLYANRTVSGHDLLLQRA